MRFWYPNKAQWRIIWAVYVVALLVSIDWTSSVMRTRALTPLELIQEANRRLERKAEISQTLKASSDGLETPSEQAIREAQLELAYRTDPVLSSPYPKERAELVDRFHPSISTKVFMLFLVIGGSLSVWRLQHRAAKASD